ncbi:hypothetical protein CR203_02180 [Salipaludibacillus neizhouensis]|uniref:YlaH-like protein n=1 Tax=Salipaludibacillus neizhouensis TaxID=885475 RepID=A0A3A9KDP1_9BACI|nr:YlaH-like family protein [Salipaludibacillus neizhouensis]RKL68870.1 hypothetical protein CR203_02180 [Salipaludibacillus neizhouensis]
MYLATTAKTVSPNLAPIAEWLGASDPENAVMAYFVMYLIINALSIVVFNLGFARKLPILKTVVVYVVMFLGNFIITILSFSLPIIESLLIAAVILGVYKIQLRRHKKEEAMAENES